MGSSAIPVADPRSRRRPKFNYPNTHELSESWHPIHRFSLSVTIRSEGTHDVTIDTAASGSDTLRSRELEYESWRRLNVVTTLRDR